jgi:hypothetical protein
MRGGILLKTALGMAALLALAACGGSDEGGGSLNQGGQDPNAPVNTDPGTTSGGSSTPVKTPAQEQEEEVKKILDARKVDYGEALRTASLKLVSELPTFDQIQRLATASNEAAQKQVYEQEIDKMMADPRFEVRMIQWWRDTLATGGPSPRAGFPSYDTAATFAAQVVLEDRSYMELFTASKGTCPTYRAGATATEKGVFTPADCTTGANAAPTAGLLTDPGLLSQYYANMAFRRVRIVQERFACSKFPAEFASNPTPMGAGTYTTPWPFDKLPDSKETDAAKKGAVNFQDTSAVICANCHNTMNRMAPLFANYDDKGVYNATTIQVQTPVPGTPATRRVDWLKDGEPLAWRNGKTVTDIVSLGKAMVDDTDVQRCAVTRVFNFAMSKGDVVNDLATLPQVVTDPYLKSFKDGGFKLKPIIAQVFKSEDFIKF